MLAGSVLDAAPEQKRRVAIMRIFGRAALAMSVPLHNLECCTKRSNENISPALTTKVGVCVCMCVGMRDGKLQGGHRT